MTDTTNDRKLEHINIIRQDDEVDRRRYYFDEVKLIHRALPELDLDAVDPSCHFLGKTLTFPLLISCMTGGDHDTVRTINRNLAEAAEATGVAMGVGSQRVQFKSPGAAASFAVRDHAPTAVLLANLGAVQLNKGFGLEECRTAVETVGADALVLHLNPLQEAVQPEGDTEFGGLADRIREITDGLEVPVILKEVGAGMSPEDAELAIRAGVTILDVAGSGGTSWSRIEHHRHRTDESDLGLTFQDWGVPTPTALRRLALYRSRITLIASGGIRSGLDMAKAVVLGASLCGIASPFLTPAMESADAVIRVIRRLEREYRTAMFLLGAARFGDLHGNRNLVLET
jgi:isopentenyl-diphosphate delta-isomerase